jgi:hypothetical protein
MADSTSQNLTGLGFVGVNKLEFTQTGGISPSFSLDNMDFANVGQVIADVTPPSITNVSIPNVAMKIGDVVTATITVASDADTLTLTSGTIGGFTLGSLTKVSATSYTATFTVANGGTDVAAGSSVPVSLVLTDAAGNASTAYTTAIVQAADRIDANRPVITNVSIANAAMKVGDVVTATITVASDADTLTLTSGAIGGFTLGSLTKVNATTYTATFTVANGGTDVAAGVDIPVSLVLSDAAGNAATAYTTAISQGGDAIDANAPVIAAVTIPNAAMKIGDVVTATITVNSDTDTYTLGTASIDGFALGSLTKVSNTSYTATFTVTSGGTDVAAGSSVPVSVVLVDSNGYSSTAYSTAIVQAADRIDANRPVITNVSIANAAMKVGDVVTATITVASDSDTLTLTSGAIGGFTLGSLTKVSATSYTVTFTVTSGGTDVAAGTDIPVSLVLSDAAGNASTAYTTAISQGADRIDATAPTLNATGSTPADNATAVAINSDLLVKFSEALDVSSNLAHVYLKSVATGTLVSATFTLNASGHLLIHPTASLAYASSYYLSWDADALKDAAGNSAAAVLASDKTTFNFTTAAMPEASPSAQAPTPAPTTDDKDNIPSAIEDATPGLPPAGGGAPVPGDGNGDGIADSQQAGVTSLTLLNTSTAQSAPGNAPPVYVSLVAGGQDGKLVPGVPSSAQITSLVQHDAPANMPAELNMPLGLLSFSVTVPQNTDHSPVNETFSLYVDPLLGANGYWVKGSAGIWINLASAAYGGQMVMEGGRLRLDFQLVDGGAFDTDGQANGSVGNLGAAAHMPLSLVGYAPPQPESGFWF